MSVHHKVTHKTLMDIAARLKALGWDSHPLLVSVSEVGSFWSGKSFKQYELETLLQYDDDLLLAADITEYLLKKHGDNMFATLYFNNHTERRVASYEGDFDPIAKIHTVLLMGFFLDNDDNFDRMRILVKRYDVPLIFRLLKNGIDFDAIWEGLENDLDAEMLEAL